MNHFIYALTDCRGNPFYVGKSKDPTKRTKRHLYDAQKGCDLPVHNKIRKLLKEGLDLGFSVLEIVSEADVDAKEQHWITEYKKLYKLFNVASGGEGGKGITPETIEKVRQANIGKKLSDESRKKISESRKGIVFSQEHKKRLSEARRKRITTEETREKMRSSSIGKINIKKYVLTDPQGVEHITERGLTDFCRNHNLITTNIHKVVKRERNHHKGWSAREWDTTNRSSNT